MILQIGLAGHLSFGFGFPKRWTPRRRRRRVCLLCPWSRTSLTALTKHGFQENDFSDDGGFKYLLFVPRTLGKRIWLVVSNILYFHLYLGKWSNLTSIFFRWVGSTTNSFSGGPRNWDEGIFGPKFNNSFPWKPWWLEDGVHHKNLVTWENRAPKDWQVAFVPWWCRVSPVF